MPPFDTILEDIFYEMQGARVVHLSKICQEAREAKALGDDPELVYDRYRKAFDQGRIIYLDQNLLDQKPCLN